MDLYNLRNNMRSRYFSMLEYLNNGFEIFKMFVKKHPLLVFSHFVFSTVMVLFITFPFTEQAIKMYEFAQKVNNTKMQKNININEYASLLSSLFSMLLLYALISLILQFVAVIIRKKAGLEIEAEEDAENEKIKKDKFKLGKITLKFIIMMAVYLIIGLALMMLIVVFSLVLDSSSALFIVSVIYFTLFFNVLYLQQIYYLRDVNLVEAFRYNLYLSKGKRLRILLPIIMIALITFFINYALNYFTGITIGKLQNLQMLGIVTSVTGGIVKTFSVLYTIIAENLVYFNVEYMDLKKLK
ncbi:hypothetical protein O3935_02650 [Leptotrichia wadei]|uniref:hypothetical protein n=1 Tax=Leptotrichia wadei TaxID=157687 RepID=UPI00352D2BA8